MPLTHKGKTVRKENFKKLFKKIKKGTKKATKAVTKTAKTATKVVTKTAKTATKAVAKTAKTATKAVAKTATKATKKVGGFGSMIKNITKKITKGVTDTFMKPINALKNSILKPIRSIEDFIRMVLCVSLYLKLVFEWCSKTIIVITKYFFATPKCFMFWVLDSFMRFLQYIVIDVILNLILQPAIYVGKILGYPFANDIKITGDNRKRLYENTNLVRWMIKGIDKVNASFKISDGCFNIGGIDPFPKYFS